MGSNNFLKKAALFFYFIIFPQTIFLTSAFSWDPPFNNAANWGGTGLMEIPTARILEDGVVRVGYAQAIPYRWYGGGMGVFPGLEVSGRFTEMTNVSADEYGNYKDKAFDLKYQILPESKRFPAVAVGFHDFHGTQLFEAQYLVFSRQVFPFDFTVGIGSKRLKGPITFPELDKMPLLGKLGFSGGLDKLGFFGGIEWAVHERLHLMAEYNPIEYEKDKRAAVPEGAKLPINVGLRIKMYPGVDLGLSWQRGDTVGLMCHLQFKLGKPIVSKRPDPPLWTSVDRSPYIRRNPKEMVTKIKEAIEAVGFQDVSVFVNNSALTAEFENTKYPSNQKAAGRVLRILLFHSPAETKELSAVFKRRQIPFLKVSISPGHLEKYLFGEMSEGAFFELLTIETIAAQYVRNQTGA